MAKQFVDTQADLFEKPPEAITALAPTQRAKVLEQLQALLTQAAANPENGLEKVDDQDQA